MSGVSDIDDLHTAVRALVASGSGTATRPLDRSKVIPGNDNGPFPDPPCATVTPIVDMPEGYAWTRETRVDNRVYTDPEFTDGPTIDAQSFLPMELSYSVRWFGDAAAEFARCFAVWSHSQAGISEFARRGLTFYRTGGIRELDAEIRGEWEQRRQLDLFIGAVFTTAEPYDVGIVESVEVTVFPSEFADRTPNADRLIIPIPTAEQEAQDG